MTKRSLRFLNFCAFVGLFSVSLASLGQETPPDWTVDNFRWTGVLAPEKAIEVLNPYGDVRLRAAYAGEVEISAMIQRRTSDPVKPEVKLGRRRGRLTIEVKYPAAPRGDLHRVDIAVFVPAGARVAVRTRDGMIQANNLANDVELESTGGNVFLTTTGTAQVSVGRGNISADLRRDDWGQAPRLRTREGDITLSLPKDIDARVQIRAPGEISPGKEGRLESRTAGRAVVTFGQGTHPLSLETHRGGVTLLTLPGADLIGEED
jgi:hypothetical protein